MPQPYLMVHPTVLGVGTTKCHGRRHLGQQHNVEWRVIKVQQADKTAHAPRRHGYLDQPSTGHFAEQTLDVAAQRYFLHVILPQHVSYDVINTAMLLEQLPDTATDVVQPIVILGVEMQQNSFVIELLMQRRVRNRNMRSVEHAHRVVCSSCDVWRARPCWSKPNKCATRGFIFHGLEALTPYYPSCHVCWVWA
jgi:hypothetical protein